MTLKEDADRLEATRAELLDEIAAKVGEREQVEERIHAKRGRDPKTEDRRDEIDREIAKLIRERDALTARAEELRTRRSKITRKLKRVAKAIRNRVRPKVYDLHLSFRSLSPNTALTFWVGHYTAGAMDLDDDDAIRLIRGVHAYHLSEGWAGIGYGACLTRQGSVIRCRPLWAVGAHTLGYNTGSVGIVCNGTTGDRPSAAQARALRWLLRNAHTRALGGDRAKTKLLGLAAKVHRQLGPTSCPGNYDAMYLSKGTKT